MNLMKRLPSHILLSASLVVAVSLNWAAQATAVEQVREFVEKLKERGLHEYALEYMEQMKDSPLAPADFKKNVLYEQGVLLVDAARRSRDNKARDDLFAAAREKLEGFAKTGSDPLLAAKASTQLANVLVERGRVLVAKAKRPSQQANRDALLEQARKLYDDARKTFEATVEFYVTELKGFDNNIDPVKEKEKFERRQAFRGELVQAKLLVATVVYERAKTFKPDTEEGKAAFTDAAERYGKMYEDYRMWLAGLYARLYQGRCLQEIGDYKTAISYFEDLLIQDENVPQFRSLMAKTYVQLAECLAAQEKYQELVDRCRPWLTKARGDEDRMPDWVALSYQLALAYYKLSEASDVQEADRAKHLKDARNLARSVSRYPSDYQDQAKELLVKLGRGQAEVGKDPTNFAEAFEAGKEAVSTMENLKRALPLIKKNDPEQVADTQQEMLDNRDNAFRYLRMALGMVDDETDIDQVNLVRYYLCYLYWETGRYYDAAVMGEFLANRYPDSSGARPCAKIAMAAYLTVYNQSTNQDKDFDARKILNVAELITRAWPGGDEANDAFNMLVSFNLQQGNTDEALAYLEKIPLDYKGRGKAELSAGQRLWTNYTRALRDKDNPTPKDELEKTKAKAQKTLEDGVARMRESGEISDTLANATLSLAQIYIDTSQFDKAIAMLEDETFGPLALLNQKHASAMREGYPEAAYKAGLRAYVTINPPQLEEAQKMMDALESLVGKGGDAESAEKLTRIYISLGLELKKQIDIEEDPAKKEQIAKSFEAFLDRIGAQERGNTWASRNWIASTYYTLGTGFEEDGKPTAKGKQYYTKAVAAYTTILNLVNAGKLQAPSQNSVLSLQMRLADCEKKMGAYREALDRLAKILEKSPMMLDAQKAAAYTYQARGEEDGKWYHFAYLGGRKAEIKDKAGRKRNENRIWGWAKLATVTQKYPKYRDVFHEARYNLAYCRNEYAKTRKTGADKKKYFNYAKNDVLATAKLYPALGGDEQREKYDRLLKTIQKNLNEKPVGLKVLDKPPETSQASRK